MEMSAERTEASIAGSASSSCGPPATANASFVGAKTVSCATGSDSAAVRPAVVTSCASVVSAGTCAVALAALVQSAWHWVPFGAGTCGVAFAGFVQFVWHLGSDPVLPHSCSVRGTGFRNCGVVHCNCVAVHCNCVAVHCNCVAVHCNCVAVSLRARCLLAVCTRHRQDSSVSMQVKARSAKKKKTEQTKSTKPEDVQRAGWASESE